MSELAFAAPARRDHIPRTRKSAGNSHMLSIVMLALSASTGRLKIDSLGIPHF
jgi:hypothetical protein